MGTSNGSIARESPVKHFIPFDDIAKPSLRNRRQQYIDKLGPDGFPTEYDPKLYARLGMSKDFAQMKKVMSPPN